MNSSRRAPGLVQTLLERRGWTGAGVILTLASAFFPLDLFWVDRPTTTGPVILIGAFTTSTRGNIGLSIDYTDQRSVALRGPQLHITGEGQIPLRLFISDVTSCRATPRAGNRSGTPLPLRPFNGGAAMFGPAIDYLNWHLGLSPPVQFADLNVRELQLGSSSAAAANLPIDCALEAGPAPSSFESRVLNFVQAWPRVATPTDERDATVQISPISFRLADLGVQDVRIDDEFDRVSIQKDEPLRAALLFRQQFGDAGVPADYVGPVAVTRMEWVDRQLNHWHELLMMLSAGIFAIALTCLLEAARPLLSDEPAPPERGINLPPPDIEPDMERNDREDHRSADRRHDPVAR